MEVKILKDSVRFKDKIYIPGNKITGFPDEEAIRLKEMGIVEILSADTENSEKDIQKLQETISDLMAEKEELVKGNETFLAENTALKEENVNLKAENEKLQQEIDTLKNSKRNKKVE